MGLFGNEAKRRAKRLPVRDWMLWSYTVRVESDQAAVAVATAEHQGDTPRDIALQLHVSCWEGVAREAVAYYGQGSVREAFESADLEKKAAAILARSQVNQTLKPMFTGDVIEYVQEMVDVSRDPDRRRELEIKDLQTRYAHINATPAPLLAEMEELSGLKKELEKRGAAPDMDLNARVKRELGVEDTPFNT